MQRVILNIDKEHGHAVYVEGKSDRNNAKHRQEHGHAVYVTN